MKFDVGALRRQFPILARQVNGVPLHYLDNAATAQMPKSVLDVMVHHEMHNRANVLRGVHALAEAATEAYDHARSRAAYFLNARPEEIVFTGGCTAAINLVAHSYGALLEAGDEIVLSELEHHSNIVPWQLLAERRGMVIRAARVTDEGRIDLESLEQCLSSRTRLLAITHASNVTGAVTDVGRVVAAARSVGAKVLLDGAQRAPHGGVDVAALDVDFYAFAGHKTYGPNGIGVLWARRELLEQMPPFMGGGQMIGRVSFAGTTYAPPPRRFEAGTPPIAQAIGLGAALDWMVTLDWPGAEAHEMRLTQKLLDGLSAVPGTRIFGPAGLQGRLPVVSFTLDGVHAHDVSQILDGYGVAVRAGHHCAQPLMDHFGVPGTTRASIAPYNDDGDVEALLHGVDEARRRLA